MNVSLYTAASAMNATSRWQETITENLASSAVPGFKKQDLTWATIEAGLLPPGTTTGALPTQFVLPSISTATNFAPGQMRHTGVNTDVAIDGPGFFEVQLPDGRLGYSRDGEFHVNARGQLVTKQGFLVLGDNGPLQFDPNLGGALTESLGIAASGEVSQEGEVRGRLRLVEFNQPQLLSAVGGGLFVAQNPGLVEVDTGSSSLMQRCLEGSNTSPMTEMTNLITAMRTFEANQRVVQLQDERMAKVISELTPV
jgi:flagellar basal-body rod protein FlgF